MSLRYPRTLLAGLRMVGKAHRVTGVAIKARAPACARRM